MIRIYADFNCLDEQGRVWLDCVGWRVDIERRAGSLREGLRVLLNGQDEFEVEATLIFDRAWRGVPDWSTLRHLDAG